MTGLRWGVLGRAQIFETRVRPALGEVVAVGSRAGGPSYDEVLADPRVEAVYIPLPNHLHVPWAIRALEAGKHVLVEKPVALDAAEARQLLAARDRTGLVVQEAFMYRHHPQWRRAVERIRGGRIGEVRVVQASFCYNRQEVTDIRNRKECGGGGLMDIGTYGIQVARLMFGQEPSRVLATMDFDPRFGTDRMTTAILQFASGQANFVVATQVRWTQAVTVIGSAGNLVVDWPFTPPVDRVCTLKWHDGEEVVAAGMQYRLQTEAFERAVAGEAPLEWPLEDAIATMEVVDAVRRSAATGGWAVVGGA